MARQTFLVEHYLPGGRLEELEQLAARVVAARLGVVHATIVPGDQSLLCVIAASSERRLRERYAAAGVEADRISPAIPAEIRAAHRQRKGDRDVE